MVGGMPTISFFYGISIRIHWDETQHSLPHFHARHGEHKASVDFTGEIIAGHLPKQQLRLVQAWVELHADELRADWELAMKAMPLNSIDPLR